MTDDEQPNDDKQGEGDAGEAPDIPPPSTFAGRRKAEQEGEAELPDPADEQEDPPDEFAFEAEPEPDEDDDAGAGSYADEPDEPAGEDVPDPAADAPTAAEPTEKRPGVSSETVEANTLALSDIEAQREAAHAGLAARAKKSSFSHQVTTGSHKVQPPRKAPPAAAEPYEPEPEDGVGEPPRRRVGWRFVAAAFVIVSSMAAATAVSFLLFLDDIADGLNDSELSAARTQLEQVDGGAPQTILILGSDKRETTEGDPGRSDTAILLRVDPEKKFLALLSLPRDLEVPIPGYYSDKINAAYSLGEQEDPSGGGEALAIKTITEYLDIPINHVVNVDFRGFYEAVNAIGCVYIDVDRHYFNENEGVFEGSEDFYAEIDVEAGYQRLCGYKALQYVRYRHGDNDLVRGARQQDFIREARQRIPPVKLLPVFGEGDELIDIFTENTSSDIDNVSTIISMMKSFVSVRDAPVRQLTLGEIADDGSVMATSEQVDTAVNQFLGNDVDADEPEPAPEPEPADSGDGSGGDKDQESQSEPPAAPGVVDFADPSAQQAAEFDRFMKHRDADLPIFYPTRLAQSSFGGAPVVSNESRAAALLGSDGKDIYYMYKFVLPYQEGFGLSYYGVSGTNWDDPPILRNPTETREIEGREYLLFYERDKLRLVGWQTSEGSYWVINTLTHALTQEQMLEVATSTRELGQ